MKKQSNVSDISVRDDARSNIASQVEEFLNSGGRIKTLKTTEHKFKHYKPVRANDANLNIKN